MKEKWSLSLREISEETTDSEETEIDNEVVVVPANISNL